MIVFESYSLYRFSVICKSNKVEGIEQGFLILNYLGYFGFLRDHSDY